MSIIQWSDTSRYNTLRTYTISSDETILTVKCEGVLYYSCTTGKEGETYAVDPDGGPYLSVGRIVQFEQQKWVIKKIVSDKKKGQVAIFVFDVQKLQ
jgi:hypothetical protein